MADFSSVAQTQKDYFFDLRPHFNAYECPSMEVLGAAIKSVFKADAMVICRPLKGRLEGIFRICPLGPPSEDKLRLERKARGTGDVEWVDVPLTTSNPNRRERQDGDLLITICDADLGAFSHITGAEFDAAFAEYGRVVIHTQPQRHYNSHLYNGNRFIVINRKGKESSKLPNRIFLKDHDRDFLIKYKNKVWFCNSCNKEHIGACDYRKELYVTRDIKMKEKITIYSIGGR